MIMCCTLYVARPQATPKGEHACSLSRGATAELEGLS
jgi:hypothetical protein